MFDCNNCHYIVPCCVSLLNRVGYRILERGGGGGYPGNCLLLKCVAFASMHATFLPIYERLGVP